MIFPKSTIIFFLVRCDVHTGLLLITQLRKDTINNEQADI